MNEKEFNSLIKSYCKSQSKSEFFKDLDPIQRNILIRHLNDDEVNHKVFVEAARRGFNWASNIGTQIDDDAQFVRALDHLGVEASVRILAS